MGQQMRSQERFEGELCRLLEELTEMALVAEELFGVSARALVARDRVQARRVAEGAGIGPSASEAGKTVQARTLALLREWSSVAANARSLMMIQQSAMELERIGDHARRIATHALALADGASAGFSSLGRAAGTDLLALIRAASAQLRGCAEVLAASDAWRAKQLASGDPELDRIYLRLVAALQEAMSREPAAALMLTRLLFAVHEIECIGNRVGNICENICYMAAGSEPVASSKGGWRAAI